MPEIKIIKFTPEQEIEHLQKFVNDLTMVEGVEYLGGKVLSIVAHIEEGAEPSEFHDIVFQVTLKVFDKKHPPTGIS